MNPTRTTNMQYNEFMDYHRCLYAIGKSKKTKWVEASLNADAQSDAMQKWRALSQVILFDSIRTNQYLGRARKLAMSYTTLFDQE